MKNVPILKLAGQFSMLQEIIRIVGATVPGLIDGKGFIDEYASSSVFLFSDRGAMADEGSGKPVWPGSSPL